MERQEREGLIKGLGNLIWVAFLALTIVVGAYVVKFAVIDKRTLSSDVDNWGVFGDYVGGVLNPVFSFLSLIGILITVSLQARQLAIARQQSQLDEIQRLLAAVATRIDQLFAVEPPLIVGLPTIKTRWELLSAVGTAPTQQTPTEQAPGIDAMPEIRLGGDAQSRAVQREFVALGLEFDGLAWCLREYIEAGGSQVVTRFYETRYRVEFMWMHSAGLVSNCPTARAFFQPEQLASHFANDAPRY